MDSTLLVLIIGLWIGLSKGGFGGPMAGAIILPLLAQRMSVSQAAGITLPLLMFADIFALRFYWRDWNLAYVRLMLPFALVGIILGTFLLASLPDITLRRLLGAFTLGVVLYKLASDSLTQLEYTSHNWHGYLAGWASGFMSALANIGGPPITAYLLLQRVTPTVFIGTITLFFFIVNLLKIPGYLTAHIIDVDKLISILWILPVIPLGVWLGRKFVEWVNTRVFEWLVIIGLVVGGLTLLLGR